MVEAVVVASTDAVAITSAEDDELFAKNFFKQKRILIISMIVQVRLNIASALAHRRKA